MTLPEPYFFNITAGVKSNVYGFIGFNLFDMKCILGPPSFAVHLEALGVFDLASNLQILPSLKNNSAYDVYGFKIRFLQML